MKTICIIPAYNEEKNIRKVLKKIKTCDNVIDKILVIDDGSEDKTVEIAKSCGADVITHVINRGTGAAQETGYEVAIREGYDYIIQLDADYQHNPEYISIMLEEIKNGYDMIIASRFLRFNSEFPFIRKIGIKFFSNFVSLLTKKKITDITSGYRIYNTEKLKKLEKINNKHWAVEQTLNAILNKLTIKEVSVKMSCRKNGKSQFDFRTLIYYPFKMLDVFLKIGINRLLK